MKLVASLLLGFLSLGGVLLSSIFSETYAGSHCERQFIATLLVPLGVVGARPWEEVQRPAKIHPSS